MCAFIQNRVPADKLMLAMIAFFGTSNANNVLLIYIIELCSDMCEEHNNFVGETSDCVWFSVPFNICWEEK